MTPAMPVTPAQMIGSNIPENDAPAYSPTTTFSVGDRVTYENRVFIALADGLTGKAPVAGPDWVDAGAINRYRAFDASQLASEGQGSLWWDFRVKERVQRVALIDPRCSTVRLRVWSAGGEPLVDRTEGVADLSTVLNWTDFFTFSGRERRLIVFDDLLILPGARMRIDLDGVGTVSVREIVAGSVIPLGRSIYGGTGSEPITLTVVNRDQDFDTVRVVRRVHYRKTTIESWVEKAHLARVQNELIRNTGRPSLFLVGEGDYDDLLGLVGFGSAPRVTLNSPAGSFMMIEVEEMGQSYAVE